MMTGILTPLMNPLLSGPLPAKPRVYLTFDDGPYEATAEVLDALATTQVKATFFLCVKNLEKKPELQFNLIRRMLTEGHSIGNHGYDHDPETVEGYKHSTTDAVKKDFTDNIEKLKQLFTTHNATFRGFEIARLPGDGKTFKSYVRMITQELGVQHAGWDFEFAPNGRFRHVNVPNWQKIRGVAATAAGFPQPDDVLLLHDAHWKGKGKLVVQIINKLKQRFQVQSLSAGASAHCIRYPN